MIDKSISNRQRIIDEQRTYFGDLFGDYGDSPQGLSSESDSHKKLRYEKLVEPIFQSKTRKISIHDVGMGTGSLLEFLNKSYGEEEFEYSGTELVPEYIEFARSKFPGIKINMGDVSSLISSEVYDWVCLSGVFHQKRNRSDIEWETYMQETLLSAYEIAKIGIAFNLVAPYTDYRLPNIYYATFQNTLEFVVNKLSRFFSIQHNYPLFEYTVHVIKPSEINYRYTEELFKKYLIRDL